MERPSAASPSRIAFIARRIKQPRKFRLAFDPRDDRVAVRPCCNHFVLVCLYPSTAQLRRQCQRSAAVCFRRQAERSACALASVIDAIARPKIHPHFKDAILKRLAAPKLPASSRRMYMFTRSAVTLSKSSNQSQMANGRFPCIPESQKNHS